MEKKLTFICTCNGCAGRRNDYDRASLEAVLAELDQSGSRYFSPVSMRWHGSRATGWHKVSGGRVIVQSTEKAGFEDSLGRVKRLTLFCPYGNVIEAEKFTTARQVQINLFKFYGDKVCSCHGCQIDRGGRNS